MNFIAQAHQVSVTFGSGQRAVHALKGVSMGVAAGEVLGIVGESGSGKSTLARVLMGLVKPTEGRVEVPSSRLDMQMVFQDPYASLNPRMTIFSVLAEALQTRCAIPTAALAGRIAELMKLVGLDAGAMLKYPHEFSGGQRQRIAIARALAPQPKVLVADEPVSALDVSIQAQILNLLADLRQQLGLTMLFVSHDLHIVRHISDRVLVMQHGEVVESGEAAQVMEAPEAEYTKRLLAATPRIAFSPHAPCTA
jgi:oligopeptide transport system ATP-binding protein